MATVEERIEAFQDTLTWTMTDPTLKSSVRKSMASSSVYWEYVYPKYDEGSKKTVVTVSDKKTVKAAQDMYAANLNKKIAVLNFANAFTPGGGVTRGSRAQEESLCRSTTLYPVLNSREIRDSFYGYHCELGIPVATDSLIYSEEIVICKTDDEIPKRLTKSNWAIVDVITMAAPNNSTPRMHLDDAAQYGYHVKRAVHMLTCAAHHGVDILILGAFGCGAFKNNPEVVAKAYKDALAMFPGIFEKIEFAVYCPPGDDRNYKIFKRILGA